MPALKCDIQYQINCRKTSYVFFEIGKSTEMWSRWFIAKQKCGSMNFIGAAEVISREERKAALFTRARGMEVQRDSFSSCLVALCTSRFIIALLNEGYDIPLPLYWQDLDSFPVQKTIIHYKRSPGSKQAKCTASVRTKNTIYENRNRKFHLLCHS